MLYKLILILENNILLYRTADIEISLFLYYLCSIVRDHKSNVNIKVGLMFVISIVNTIITKLVSACC